MEMKRESPEGKNRNTEREVKEKKRAEKGLYRANKGKPGCYREILDVIGRTKCEIGKFWML